MQNGRIDGEFTPVHLKKEPVFPELQPDKEKLAHHVDTTAHEPYILYSKNDMLPSQVLVQSAAGDRRAASGTDSSLLALSGEGSASECTNAESIPAHMEPVLPLDVKKARKRKGKHRENKMTTTSSSANVKSTNVKYSKRRCPRNTLRMQVRRKASLVKLREVSSAGPVANPLEIRARYTRDQVKTYIRTFGRFALSMLYTKTNCRKQKQILPPRRRFGKVTGCTRKLEVTRPRKCLSRKAFHGQRCWKYKRKVK